MAKQLEMAAQQLTGFAHARAGYSITSLADGMGLTAKEWEAIKLRGVSLGLALIDIHELDTHFEKSGE